MLPAVAQEKLNGGERAAAAGFSGTKRPEVSMAEARHAASQATKQTEGPSEDNRHDSVDDRNREPAKPSHHRPPNGKAERFVKLGQQGMRETADASTAAASAAQRSGAAIAECTQEITAAWAPTPRR